MTERRRSVEPYGETKKLTMEAIKALVGRDYLIYSLRKKSIDSLQKSGRKFWSSGLDEKDLEQFATLSSMISQVAINPNNSFLEDSREYVIGAYQKQQQEIIAKFAEDLAKHIPDVKAVIGQAPDYAELAFAHLDATGKELFGKENDYNLTVTKTLFVVSSDDKKTVFVGDSDAENGLYVGVWGRGRGGGRGRISVMPLVVPA